MARRPEAAQARAPRLITVTIPHDVGNDIRKIEKIQKELLGRLGHQACYSGFDILFRLEGDFVVDPKTLELQPGR
jgi:hypothetical protein